MKLEILRKGLKDAVSPFEVLGSYLKTDLVLKANATNEECLFSICTNECSLSVKVDGKVEAEGELSISLAKLSEFLKKCKKNVPLSIRILNNRAVILNEELEQFDIAPDGYFSNALPKEEKINVGVVETLVLEKGLIEIGRTLPKKHDLYQMLQYAKCKFDSNELTMVSFDEDTLSIKRISISNNELSFCFYLTKFKVDLITKVLSTVVDTYASILCGKQTKRVYLNTPTIELSIPVDFLKEINLEVISNLDGRFLPTTLDVVMNDLRTSVPRRELTEEERAKYTETLNKAKKGTSRWTDAATILKYGMPVYSASEIMLKPYFCRESNRLRFTVSGTKQEATHQSFLASILIQSLKDCELNVGQIKIPENLNDPLAFVYEDESSSFERYFMLTSESY